MKNFVLELIVHPTKMKNMLFTPITGGEAMSTAIYIINRTPIAVVHNVTPKERYSDKKPDLSHLKVFCCICYVHVSDELRTKLDAKDEKCIFLGYSLEHKGYRCYNPMTRKLRISCDVVFDELASWYALPPVVVDDGKPACGTKYSIGMTASNPNARLKGVQCVATLYAVL